MAEHKIGPGPKYTCQASDDENAFIVAEPNGKNDRRGIEQNQGDLMACSQIEPTNCEEQHQRLDKGERWRLTNEKAKHTHSIRSSTLWEQISRQSLPDVLRFRRGS